MAGSERAKAMRAKFQRKNAVQISGDSDDD